jgi:hypothetical protein
VEYRKHSCEHDDMISFLGRILSNFLFFIEDDLRITLNLKKPGLVRLRDKTMIASFTSPVVKYNHIKCISGQISNQERRYNIPY